MLYGVMLLENWGISATQRGQPRKALWPGEGAPGMLVGLGMPRPLRAHLAFHSPPQSGNPGLVFGVLREAVTSEAGPHLMSENLSR